MAETTSPLSVQTTMPSYPDVTYETYRSRYGGGYKNRLAAAIYAWHHGAPNYQTFRQNELDAYNASVEAYKAYATSPAGNRAQLESAGYNANYNPGTVSEASPLSYQDSNPGNGFSEMAQGVQGALSLADAITGFKFRTADMVANLAMKRAQIKNMEAKTAGTLTDNLYKDPMWRAKVLGLDISNKWNPILNRQKEKALQIANQWNPALYGRQFDLLGYQADKVALENSVELASRFGEGSYVSPTGSGYDLTRTKSGLAYQQAYNDLQLTKATRDLQKQQTEVAKFTAKEKDFYTSSIQGIYKDFLQTQLGLAQGQLSFQKIEQDIKRKAFKWNVGLGVANTTINAVKTGISLISPLGRAMNGAQTISVSPVDIADYGAYGAY